MHGVAVTMKVDPRDPLVSQVEVRYSGPRGHLIGSYGVKLKGLETELAPVLFSDAAFNYLFGETPVEAIRSLRATVKEMRGRLRDRYAPTEF